VQGLQMYVAKNIRFQCWCSLMYWINPSAPQPTGNVLLS